jgi:hypothetical protein
MLARRLYNFLQAETSYKLPAENIEGQLLLTKHKEEAWNQATREGNCMREKVKEALGQRDPIIHTYSGSNSPTTVLDVIENMAIVMIRVIEKNDSK